MVCNLFILRIASFAAACSVTPKPPPEIAISVTAFPLRSPAILNSSTNSSSKNNCNDSFRKSSPF